MIAVLVAASACGDAESPPPMDEGDAAAPPGAEERLQRWKEERPGEPMEASVAFQRPLADSTVSALLQRHDVVPFAAWVRVAGLSTSHRIPPEDASLRMLDALRNQVTTGIGTALCAQQGRARAMLREGDPDPAAASAVLGRVERSMEALERLDDAGVPYIYGVAVEGMVPELRGLVRDPLVARLEPADIVDDRVVVPDPRAPGDGAGPATGEVAAPPPDSVLIALRRLAERGLPGCEPAPPPAAVSGR